MEAKFEHLQPLVDKLEASRKLAVEVKQTMQTWMSNQAKDNALMDVENILGAIDQLLLAMTEAF